MRITADTHRCLGAGQCVLSDPDRFDQSDDGTVLLLRAPVTGPEEEALVRGTVALCPSQALTLEA
ncbi:ferredoxin [Streptomyces sp. NBC_00090]|uniref:ferredoxin n=1 Tax=Streptomyces sp. NBC_00090 TaxID=2903619 RepID=UPI0032444328